MGGLLFIIAATITTEQLNLLLLNLRDWSDGDDHDSFNLITSRNGWELSRTASSQSVTSPPVKAELASENGWAGASLADVEGFCVDLGRGAVRGQANGQLYVVVDEEGLRDGNCVVGERACVLEGEDFETTEEFNKMRVPWEQTGLMWGIIDIGEGWVHQWAGEEGVVDDAGNPRGQGPGGWFTFSLETAWGDSDKAAAKAKEKAIRRFRERGWI